LNKEKLIDDGADDLEPGTQIRSVSRDLALLRTRRGKDNRKEVALAQSQRSVKDEERAHMWAVERSHR
jgi:hypothetical protein